MKEKECFTMVDKRCSALTVTDCEDCVFYKTKEEAKRGRQLAIQIILRLDEDVRDYIIEKYYGGEMEVSR